ncbi:MAG TPA: ABC transporter permease [Thermomicrobiales bacterium]|nr:ABC transporter permease [Thermomicrobiales bacterium]
MTRYIVARVLWLGPVLLGVSLLVFGIMKLMPGDVARALVGTDGTAEDVAAMRQTLGLDQPVYVQYGRFLGRLVRLDLGNSAVTKRPVTTEIASRIRPTADLAGAALAIALVLGLLSGVVSATLQYTVWDSLATLVSLVGISMPIFWLGLMLMLLFSVRLGWLPSTGAGTPAQLVLPALTLGSASTAIIARQTRSSLLEVLRQDYVRTARAKGLRGRAVLLRHALPNALIPTVTVVGLQVGYLLGGSVLTETVFARPGLGRLLVDSIESRDIAVVQGTIMLFAAIFVVINLLVDLLYLRLDPRIRYD